MDRLQRVKCRLLLQKPWYGVFSAMMHWREVPATVCKTMGVCVMNEGTVDAVFNRQFCETLTDDAMACVIVHEIDHVVRLHCLRKFGRMRLLWGLAADAVVNGRRERPKITVRTKSGEDRCFLHDDCIWYDFKEENLTTEEVYDRLKKDSKVCSTCGAIHVPIPGHGGKDKEKDKKEKDDGKPRCPECGASPDEVTWVDDHDVWEQSSANEDKARSIVADKVDQAGKVAGNAPGHLEDAIKGLKEPRIDWRREMSEWLGRKCGGSRICIGRPNRRTDLFGVPGLTNRAMAQVTVFVDTSGSMGRDELEEAFGNVDKIAWRSRVTLVEFDHGIEHVSKYRRGMWQEITIHGRGGTSVIQALEEAEQQGLIGDVNVIITDGELAWPTEKPYEILWYIVSSSKQLPPWGKVVQVG